MEGTLLIAFGVVAILAGPVMFWVALPNKEGNPPHLLRSDFVQAVYSIAIMAVMLIGVAALIHAR